MSFLLTLSVQWWSICSHRIIRFQFLAKCTLIICLPLHKLFSGDQQFQKYLSGRHLTLTTMPWTVTEIILFSFWCLLKNINSSFLPLSARLYTFCCFLMISWWDNYMNSFFGYCRFVQLFVYSKDRFFVYSFAFLTLDVAVVFCSAQWSSVHSLLQMLLLLLYKISLSLSPLLLFVLLP